ncbi:MAG: large repetitive protein, partial [Blastocatellia bacterium]|nr:large repetitive protein [Blastocatellia bacterium]
MQSPPYLPIRRLRVFSACLLSLLMLLAPMAPLAASANRLEAADAARKSARTGAVDKKKKPTAREALERSLFVDPLPAGSPVISATLQDSIVDTSPADGLADPGSIVTYKAVITNNGNTDLTNVSYKDVIDPNTTLINGSIKMAPLARNDSYNTSQDTQLVVAAGSGVLANDSGTPAPTAVVITAFATAHGTVDNLN